MTKFAKQIPIRVTPAPASLFPDSLNEKEKALLELADGTRALSILAAALDLAVPECESLIGHLINLQYLRPALLEETQAALATLPNLGRHQDAIALAKHILAERRGDLPTLTLLANLYEITARPADAAAQWQFISHIHRHEQRPAEALRAARKAAALQPLSHSLQLALADLCLQTGRQTEAVRVFGNYARCLSDNRMPGAALAVIDYAVQQLPGNDALLLAEAEILAAGNGVRRRRHGKKKLTISRAAALSLAVCVAVVGALGYAIGDYAAREMMMGASDAATRTLQQLGGLSPYRKWLAVREVEENLRRAAPLFASMTIPDYVSATARAGAHREKIEEELRRQRAYQQQCWERWRQSPADWRPLVELLLFDDPESPALLRARAECPALMGAEK
ncbi:MAG: hypothetical protein LBP75_01680 [Planctomycetota bacterium]|jgi:tetratricopeptide (TPR) repeat protein|nr:hypothetical protein [Planctomycetota bacterium]